MKSILAYTNFSPASYNAARYAIALANQLKSSGVILYNTVMPLLNQNPSGSDLLISEESSIPNLAAEDIDEIRKASEKDLMNFKQTLGGNDAGVNIKTVSDYNTITNGILETTKIYDVGIIVMAVEQAQDKIEELFIGGDALDVARESEVPVILIPSNVKFESLNRILFACDFKKVTATTPVNAIKLLLDITKAALFVLHVEANADDFKPEMTIETLALDNLLGNYNPEYNFAANKNFAEAINRFALENKIDLIITTPKKHGWLESIFTHSHTKELAYHTHIPLMTIHAKS